ncbi:hypothetical protein WH50_15750 [Pokkaliibacter plantistimulans]|uniref:Nickel/cobalt efflux system n=1 Tax=Pokkaliibacter plantistimulans TaxID=1635171 RepID=A0ABX5LUN6_9GAMM|nr:hypothetical protein [Pokkaliibacter plantistimulans]PXF30386.1 hypothetical protein WH50_15750 [Pokkaliibacter plantistimulans]
MTVYTWQGDRPPRQSARTSMSSGWVVTASLVLLILAVLPSEVLAAGLREQLAADHSWWADWVNWIQSTQISLHRKMVAATQALIETGDGWLLWGLSFAYGVFHAAGPGHGKAVISSYLLADRSRWRQGMWLSAGAAMVQGLVAVVLVGVLAGVLALSAKVTQYVQLLEQVSYLAIALFGVVFAWRVWRGTHHCCGHDHHGDHARGHHPRALARSLMARPAPQSQTLRFTRLQPLPSVASGTISVGGSSGTNSAATATRPDLRALWRQRLTIVTAIGLRPCSGAVLLLVFCLSQHIFWYGVLGVVLMAVGTALTVCVLATLAVWAREVGYRLLRERPRGLALLDRCFGFAAALVMMLMGTSLFIGTLAAPGLLR